MLAPRYRRRGRYLSQALDSEIDDCTWHRVELRGCMPAGCSVTLRTLTADILLNEAELDVLDDSAWSVPVVATTMAEGRWDALIRSEPGRHAWLSLELAGDGFETPQVDAALVEYPRISLRRYLPAVFGMERTSADFTDRFTAIFDASLRSIEGRLDRQAMLFDPLSAPAEGLDGHAGFLGGLASGRPDLAVVRGWGLALAVDVVDPATGRPDAGRAARIVEGMRERGVLVGRTGRDRASLKIRPPLVFSRSNADLLAETLGEVLAAL